MVKETPGRSVMLGFGRPPNGYPAKGLFSPKWGCKTEYRPSVLQSCSPYSLQICKTAKLALEFSFAVLQYLGLAKLQNWLPGLCSVVQYHIVLTELRNWFLTTHQGFRRFASFLRRFPALLFSAADLAFPGLRFGEVAAPEAIPTAVGCFGW